MRPLQDNPYALMVGGLLVLAALLAFDFHWLAVMALLLPAAVVGAGLHRRRLAGLATSVERVADGNPSELPYPASPCQTRGLYARLIHAVERLARRLTESDEAHQRALADAERLAGDLRERDARLGQLGNKALDTIVAMHELLLEIELDPAQRRQASAGAESALGLLASINEGLDRAQLEERRVDARPRACDPEAIVKSAVGLLAARAHARGVALTVFCDPAVPASVDTEPSLLRQILINLVAHAVGCAADGGVQVRLQRDSTQESLRIAVAAPGARLASEARTALLAEVSRTDGDGGRPQSSAARAFRVSRRLARVLGGDIGLDDTAAEDCCLSLTLPLPAAVPDGERAAAAEGLTERIARCALDAPLVLLAEDSPANQLVATNMLEKAGFRVDVVENGRQAVSAVKQRAYAVVLMDLAMPEMDGLEATGRIRALPGSRGRIPIVAMTAYALDEDRRRCLEAGMDGYLSKPIDRRKLLEALLEWVDRARTERLPDGAAAPVAADRAAAAVTDAVEADGGAPDPAAPIVDEAVAGALARDLSDALMPQVVATFVGEVRERVLAIEQASAAGDSTRAGEQGHALKGSAATFGAAALHERALSIERAGRAGRIDEVRALAAGLGACGEAVIDVLERRWGGVDSADRSTRP